MAKRKVFYSFHYKNDVFRTQQVRNMGALEGNEPVSANEWETVKRGGNKAIEKWISDNMYGRSCIVVLIGEETHERQWVKYEIKKAVEDGKGLLGIYVHNLNCMVNGKCSKGTNPFEQFTFNNGTKLSTVVKCYNPSKDNAYSEIHNNIEDWIEQAIEDRKNLY